MPIRVLIVDDDSAFRRTIAAVLTARGYEIAGEASSLAEARLAIQRLNPDAVLLDVNLPDGNGISLAADLPPTGDAAPRIVLTSSDTRAAPARLSSGARASPVSSPRPNSSPPTSSPTSAERL
jgi:DNA-binding NarL/FixJ family response regulator